MTVKGIAKEWLIEHGYNGLYNEYGECGCGIDDMFPCCESWETLDDCEPAYHNTCDNCTIMTTCEYRATTDAIACYSAKQHYKEDCNE